jgi:hypothetical protein
LVFLTEHYLAINDEEIGASDSFQTPIPTYYRLYKVSQENRQIQQVNQTYIKMEDVKLRQFSYEYKTYDGLENWISWKLNWLLKLYTDYGTTPSKTITMSLIVFLIFSTFYFFF